MHPTFVLLPGMIGTADLFRPLLAAIPDSLPWRVVSYPTNVFLPYPEVLKLIERELADEQQMILIGESYSGALALQFAAAHPQRVRAVVVSGAFVSPPWPTWLRIFIRPILLRIRMPSVVIRFFAAGKYASDSFVDEIRHALSRPLPRVMVQRAREALAMDNTESLVQCKAPILYLAPTNDRLVRSHNVRHILKIRPDVRVQKLDGPHLILQTASAPAWSEILRFVASI